VPRTLILKVMRAEGCEDLPLPQQMTAGAAGLDLPAAVARPTVLRPRQIMLVPCGFHMAVPRGYEAQVRPRSGLASKYGITLINAPGTIDSDYRGQVMVPLINLGPKPFKLTRGMRIAQMLICPTPRVKVVQVDSLDSTARGHGGFGHSGH